jgi:hypothetical protein
MHALLLAIALLAQPQASETTPLTPAAEDAVAAVRTAVADARRRLDRAGPPESVAGELYRRVAVEQAGRRAMAALDGLPPEQQRAAHAQAWAVLGPIDATTPPGSSVTCRGTAGSGSAVTAFGPPRTPF